MFTKFLISNLLLAALCYICSRKFCPRPIRNNVTSLLGLTCSICLIQTSIQASIPSRASELLAIAW